MALVSSGAVAQSPPSAKDWCEHVLAGPAGTKPAPVAFSEAHAQVRFFGTGPSYSEADQALVVALEGPRVDWDEAIVTYASAQEPACALDASANGLGRAHVLSFGPLAHVRPGTGGLSLPRGTQAVVIDLRGLPAAPGLEEALARALGVASRAPVERGSHRVRVHQGLSDEARPSRLYTNSVEPRSLAPHGPLGDRDLPVVLLTGPRLAPAAARFAVELRMARRAWLVGAPLTTAVAESRWMPVGARGVVVRTALLEDAEGILPDVIPADLALSLPRPVGTSGLTGMEHVLQQLVSTRVPPPVRRDTPGTRPGLTVRTPSLEPVPPSVASNGVARAALVIAHGATRWFFPYFPVVGDGIDERLMETLAQVDARPVTQRMELSRLMQRFSEVLRDGHAFVQLVGVAPAGYFPVMLDQVDGKPVVNRSALPEVQKGDVLVSVGGRSMTDWLADELPRTSGSTPESQLNFAFWRLQDLKGPTVFGLRGVDGHLRSVEVQPQPYEALAEVLGSRSRRAAGSLVDLGAPSLHYINLGEEVLYDIRDYVEALHQARHASGLVLDMRGYPSVNPYDVVQHLIPHPYLTPYLRIPRWSGPDHLDWEELVYEEQPVLEPSFSGPMVLLVGPETASAAEHLSMMLTGADRVTVIGRRSAAVNGNVTRVRVPGMLYLTFTGMEVLFQDRGRFHGVGIVPDIEVAPEASDFATGRDPELLRAIQFLQSGQ
ncbi:peptidase S41 [Myxococcus sp. AM011]|nr:peptidase S41 [Myxococcus sp. AM011]